MRLTANECQDSVIATGTTLATVGDPNVSQESLRNAAETLEAAKRAWTALPKSMTGCISHCGEENTRSWVTQMCLENFG